MLSILNFLSFGLVICSMGKRFRLSAFDDVSHIQEDYENEIRSWFNIETGDVFVDVGANIGFYSLLLSSKAAHVLAFEPCLRTFQALTDNLELNHTMNVYPFNYALSDYTGRASLHVTGHSGHNSLRIVPDAHSLEDVFTLKFDDVKYMPKRMDLVKIDVEGAELDVLKGMRNSILKYCPRLIVEVKPFNESGFSDFIDSINYRVIDRCGENVLASP